MRARYGGEAALGARQADDQQIGGCLRGKSKVQQATPPVPERTVQSVKEDVRYTKQRAQEARQ